MAKEAEEALKKATQGAIPSSSKAIVEEEGDEEVAGDQPIPEIVTVPNM